MDWTFDKIRSEVRKLTGRRSSNSLSTADLNDRINNFYTLIMPYELDLHELSALAQFSAVAGTGEYVCTAGGVVLTFNTTVLTLGGALVTFSGEASDILRIEPGVKASDASGVESDVELYLDPIGFKSDYPDQQHDEASERNRPSGLLYFENTFTLRPVPDADYTVKFPAKLQRPPELSADNDVPWDNAWGWFIAHGAAIQIHKAAGEHDEAEAIGAMYEQLKSVISRKQILRYPATHRAAPRF